MPKIIAHGVKTERFKRVIGNYVDDIDGDMSYDFVVPTGKRWYVYGGFAERRGQNPVFQVYVYDASGQEILQSDESGADSKDVCWGCMGSETTLKDFCVPFPLEAGWKVEYRFHVSPYDSSVSLLVEEEDA